MTRTLLTRILLSLAIGLPVLLLGAVHSETLGVLLLIACMLYILLLNDAKISLDFVGGLFLALIAFTVFQLLPLPSEVVKWLSPVAFDLRLRSMEMLGQPLPSFIPISVDVTLTLEEVAKLVLYLSIYWTIKKWSRHHGTRFVLYAITVTGALCAAILLIHKIAMLDTVYGFYVPTQLQFSGYRVSAPLLNENHMAAFLSLCFFASIGVATQIEERSKKMILIVISSITGGALLLTLSRGGIAAFLAGQLLFVTLLILRSVLYRRHSARKFENLSWVPLGLAFTLGLGMIAAQDAIIGEYVTHDAKKMEMVTEAMPLLKMFPLFGAGRGAFVMVFPLVSEWSAGVTFTRAENVIVQLLVDYGVVIGPLVLMAFVFPVIGRMLQIPSRAITAALISGLLAVGIHNLVDFNLEIPAVAVIAISMLASLMASKKKSKNKQVARKTIFVPRTLIAAAAVGSLSLCSLLFFYLPSKTIETEQEIARLALENNQETFFQKSNLIAMMQRHPSSYYLSFLAGVYHYRHGTLSPLPFWSRSVELNPHSGAAHYFIGKVLLEKNFFNQAMMEFRFASRNDSRYASSSAVALVNVTKNFTQLKHWAVTGNDKLLLYEALAREFARRGLDEQSQQADLRLLQQKTPTVGALSRQANRLATKNPQEAIQLTTKLGWLSGQKLNSILLRANIYFINNQPQEAINTLKQAPKPYHSDARYLKQIAWVYQKSNLHDNAIATAKKLRAVSDSTRGRARAVEFEGDLERQQGDINSALSRYKQAGAMIPDDKRILVKLLQTAQLAKNHKTVLHTLKRLHQRFPKESQWKDALEAEQKKIFHADI